MEINPFKTKISFRQYIDIVKPPVDALSTLSSIYYQFKKSIHIEYFETNYVITGYHINKNIPETIDCILISTDLNNRGKTIFIDSKNIELEVEVVLKSELKNIKSVEQLNLFSNE